MSTTRSRVTTRAQKQSSDPVNQSNASISRVRSTTARDRSAPYGTLTRRASARQDESSSSVSKGSGNNKNRRTKEVNISDSHLPDIEPAQNIVVDQSHDNDESLRNASNSNVRIINSNSGSTNTTSANNIARNSSLNHNTTETSTTMTNGEVGKLFTLKENGLYSCSMCQQVKYMFSYFVNIGEHQT
jgi:hypothetical protein